MEFMLIGLAVLVVILLIWGVSTYNNFVGLRNKCEEAFSTMDVYLKKRYDLIPNLVETVKGYAKHEEETLDKVVRARNLAVGSKTNAEKLENEKQVQSLLGNVFAIAESYPDLKANTNFIDLQKQLQKMEEDIANARKYYNGVVRTYNTLTEKIPSNIIASVAKFEREPLFMVNDETERENVKVQF